MSVFSDFLPDFFADAPPISQNKTVSKVNFSIIHLVRTVCELTSSIIQTHYTRTTLFCLHLRKLFSIEDRRTNTFSYSNVPCVLLSLMPMRRFLNSCCLVRVCFLGFVRSSSSSSVSCSHLSSTASNSNPPYRKMANFRKVSMQSRSSLLCQTCLTNKDRLYTSAREMA